MKSDKRVETDKLLRMIQNEYLTLNNLISELNTKDALEILKKIIEIEGTLEFRNEVKNIVN